MTKRRDRNRTARALCAHLWEIEEHAQLKERLTAAYPKSRTRNHWKGNR